MFQAILVLSLAMTAAGVDGVTLTGNAITRELHIEHGHLRTSSFRNDHRPGVTRADGPEFVLTYGDGASVDSDAFTVEDLRSTDTGVRASLSNATLGLNAVIDYSAAAKGPWLYKKIHFVNTGTSPFLLRTVEVEHLKLPDEKVTYAVSPEFLLLGDWGQPVYTDSFWFGLEFPASRSSATSDGTIFLRHHPGCTLAPGEVYETRRAVVGAAEPGTTRPAFMAYVRTLTPLPDPPRTNIYWNGFRVITPPDRTSKGLAMVNYAKKLRDVSGFTFDGWSYDAGFDMYRPDALFVPNEPDIWNVTREALRPIDTPLGFWTSFSPIFDTPTHAWGKTQGYELQHNASYCLAGPTYYKAIRERLEDVVRTYGMNTINFDGMYWGQGFGCNQPGHGHLVGEGSEVGVYALEKVVENKLAIFESLRRINPKIVLDLFVCGEWASPWWLTQLDGVHTVAGDTLGCDIPSPWLRDELITVRDIQVFDEHRRQNRQFPLWAEDLYGTQVRSDHLIDGVELEGESMAACWEDEFVLAFAGRGAISNHIICCDLGVLDQSASGLRFLGEVGNWVRRNASIYREFKLLGGDPGKRQAYGYAHGDGKGRSLVALRNPWIEPQGFSLVLDEQLDLGVVKTPVYVNIIYPFRQTIGPVAWGDTVPIPLQDYDVLLLEVRTGDRQFPGLPNNARWTLDGEGKSIQLDSASLQEIPSGDLQQWAVEDGLELLGKVSVPATSDGAQMMLMLRPADGSVKKPTIFVDGNETAFAYHLRTRGAVQDAWALTDLSPGAHEVRIRIPDSSRGQIGAWLRASYTLKQAPGTSGKVVDGDFFPVYAPESDRRVATLLPVTYYAPPLPALPDGKELDLSELRGRCVLSKVGFFSVGWDASCWPEDPVLRIGNTVYTKGLGVHAPAEQVFDIAGAFNRLTAEVGLHGIPPEKKKASAPLGTCTFIVEGDGKVLYESPVLREGDAPQPIDIRISGVHQLTLKTTSGGDSNYDDLSAWGNARLYR